MTDHNQFKLFEVEEANRLIPSIEKLILELRDWRESLLSLEVEIDALELVSEKNRGDIPSPLKNKLKEYQDMMNHFYSIVDQIHETGCYLKDIPTGLVDFYSLYQGRVVYLCWRLGEEKVTSWHEIGRGYMDRQPLVYDNQQGGSGKIL